LRLLESRDNQQDGVGPSHGRLINLDLVQDEILAQTGQRHGAANLGEIGQMPVKVWLVREHGDGVGARGLVLQGDGHGIEFRGDHPGARTGFLDLGDEAQGIGAAIQRGREGPEIIALQSRGAQVFEPRQNPGDLGFFRFEDFLQAIHRAW